MLVSGTTATALSEAKRFIDTGEWEWETHFSIMGEANHFSFPAYRNDTLVILLKRVKEENGVEE